MNTHQVRKLTKKTVVIISIIIAIAFIIFYIMKDLKEKRISEVLATIGYRNIKQLKVINNKWAQENHVTTYTTIQP